MHIDRKERQFLTFWWDTVRYSCIWYRCLPLSWWQILSFILGMKPCKGLLVEDSLLRFSWKINLLAKIVSGSACWWKKVQTEINQSRHPPCPSVNINDCDDHHCHISTQFVKTILINDDTLSFLFLSHSIQKRDAQNDHYLGNPYWW